MIDDARTRRLQTAVRGLLAAIELIGLSITVVALADRLLHLGWGYELTAVFFGLGVMLAGVLLYFVCRGIFAIGRARK